MADDVLITPASRKIEFFDSSNNIDAKIELDSSGNLVITNPGGDISLGDTTADIFVGDGVNNIDIVFEQNGEIRGVTGVTLTLGQSDSNVQMATDLDLNTNDLVTGSTVLLPSTIGSAGQALKINSGGTAAEWGDVGGGGATGGGSDAVFHNNDQTVTTNYSIPSGQNSMSAGPITINSGVTVTVPSGSEWTIV